MSRAGEDMSLNPSPSKNSAGASEETEGPLQWPPRSNTIPSSNILESLSHLSTRSPTPPPSARVPGKSSKSPSSSFDLNPSSIMPFLENSRHSNLSLHAASFRSNTSKFSVESTSSPLGSTIHASEISAHPEATSDVSSERLAPKSAGDEEIQKSVLHTPLDTQNSPPSSLLDVFLLQLNPAESDGRKISRSTMCPLQTTEVGLQTSKSTSRATSAATDSSFSTEPINTASRTLHEIPLCSSMSGLDESFESASSSNATFNIQKALNMESSSPSLRTLHESLEFQIETENCADHPQTSSDEHALQQIKESDREHDSLRHISSASYTVDTNVTTEFFKHLTSQAVSSLPTSIQSPSILAKTSLDQALLDPLCIESFGTTLSSEPVTILKTSQHSQMSSCIESLSTHLPANLLPTSVPNISKESSQLALQMPTQPSDNVLPPTLECEMSSERLNGPSIQKMQDTFNDSSNSLSLQTDTLKMAHDSQTSAPRVRSFQQTPPSQPMASSDASRHSQLKASLDGLPSKLSSPVQISCKSSKTLPPLNTQKTLIHDFPASITHNNAPSVNSDLQSSQQNASKLSLKTSVSPVTFEQVCQQSLSSLHPEQFNNELTQRVSITCTSSVKTLLPPMPAQQHSPQSPSPSVTELRTQSFVRTPCSPQSSRNASTVWKSSRTSVQKDAQHIEGASQHALDSQKSPITVLSQSVCSDSQIPASVQGNLSGFSVDHSDFQPSASALPPIQFSGYISSRTVLTSPTSEAETSRDISSKEVLILSTNLGVECPESPPETLFRNYVVSTTTTENETSGSITSKRTFDKIPPTSGEVSPCKVSLNEIPTNSPISITETQHVCSSNDVASSHSPEAVTTCEMFFKANNHPSITTDGESSRRSSLKQVTSPTSERKTYPNPDTMKTSPISPRTELENTDSLKEVTTLGTGTASMSSWIPASSTATTECLLVNSSKTSGLSPTSKTEMPWNFSVLTEEKSPQTVTSKNVPDIPVNNKEARGLPSSAMTASEVMSKSTPKPIRQRKSSSDVEQPKKCLDEARVSKTLHAVQHLGVQSPTKATGERLQSVSASLQSCRTPPTPPPSLVSLCSMPSKISPECASILSSDLKTSLAAAETSAREKLQPPSASMSHVWPPPPAPLELPTPPAMPAQLASPAPPPPPTATAPPPTSSAPPAQPAPPALLVVRESWSDFSATESEDALPSLPPRCYLTESRFSRSPSPPRPPLERKAPLKTVTFSNDTQSPPPTHAYPQSSEILTLMRPRAAREGRRRPKRRARRSSPLAQELLALLCVQAAAGGCYVADPKDPHRALSTALQQAGLDRHVHALVRRLLATRGYQVSKKQLLSSDSAKEGEGESRKKRPSVSDNALLVDAGTSPGQASPAPTDSARSIDGFGAFGAELNWDFPEGATGSVASHDKLGERTGAKKKRKTKDKDESPAAVSLREGAHQRQLEVSKWHVSEKGLLVLTCPLSNQLCTRHLGEDAKPAEVNEPSETNLQPKPSATSKPLPKLPIIKTPKPRPSRKGLLQPIKTFTDSQSIHTVNPMSSHDFRHPIVPEGSRAPVSSECTLCSRNAPSSCAMCQRAAQQSWGRSSCTLCSHMASKSSSRSLKKPSSMSASRTWLPPAAEKRSNRGNAAAPGRSAHSPTPHKRRASRSPVRSANKHRSGSVKHRSVSGSRRAKYSTAHNSHQRYQRAQSSHRRKSRSSSETFRRKQRDPSVSNRKRIRSSSQPQRRKPEPHRGKTRAVSWSHRVNQPSTSNSQHVRYRSTSRSKKPKHRSTSKPRGAQYRSGRAHPPGSTRRPATSVQPGTSRRPLISVPQRRTAGQRGGSTLRRNPQTADKPKKLTRVQEMRLIQKRLQRSAHHADSATSLSSASSRASSASSMRMASRSPSTMAADSTDDALRDYCQSRGPAHARSESMRKHFLRDMQHVLKNHADEYAPRPKPCALAGAKSRTQTATRSRARLKKKVGK